MVESKKKHIEQIQETWDKPLSFFTESTIQNILLNLL